MNLSPRRVAGLPLALVVPGAETAEMETNESARRLNLVSVLLPRDRGAAEVAGLAIAHRRLHAENGPQPRERRVTDRPPDGSPYLSLARLPRLTTRRLRSCYGLPCKQGPAG